MHFGIYCEVQIETLRQIKLKYVEDYESLVQFLTDFHLLKNRPSILGIDSVDFFLENKNLSANTKQMRLHFLLNLALETKNYLDQSSTFSANNLILAYRCASNFAEAGGNLQGKPTSSDDSN